MSPQAPKRLALPRVSLGACLRGVMQRDTRGLDLDPLQRLNYFPATPLFSLCWWFHGRSEMLRGPFPAREARLEDPREPIAAPIALGGPFSHPSVSWNPGPVHGMMAMLMPDALRLMTGIDPEPLMNRLVDVREVLPPDWVAMCEAVAAETDDDMRVQRLQDFLEPRWQAARPKLALRAHRYQDWAHGLMLRAAQTAAGSSLRQLERRIKAWTGQPMRALQGFGRTERAFFEAVAAGEQAPVRWADVAAASGYADQSHLTRATRRMTGFTPADLYRRIRDEESFWAYRMWM